MCPEHLPAFQNQDPLGRSLWTTCEEQLFTLSSTRFGKSQEASKNGRVLIRLGRHVDDIRQAIPGWGRSKMTAGGRTDVARARGTTSYVHSTQKGDTLTWTAAYAPDQWGEMLSPLTLSGKAASYPTTRLSGRETIPFASAGTWHDGRERSEALSVVQPRVCFVNLTPGGAPSLGWQTSHGPWGSWLARFASDHGPTNQTPCHDFSPRAFAVRPALGMPAIP